MKKRGLKLLLCVLLAACSVNKEKETATYVFDRPELSFVIASDLHYLADELNDKGAMITSLMALADGKYTLEMGTILDVWITEVLDLAPDFVVLTGDLSFNGEKKSHKELSQKLRQLIEAGIKVFVLPGNHDLTSSAYGFKGDSYYKTETIDETEWKTIYQDFGYALSFSQDPASLSYSVLLNENLMGIFLDGQSVSLPEETLLWLKQQKAEAAKRDMQILSFTHESLIDHTTLFSGYTITEADEILDIYDQKLTVNFSGHLHPQHIQRSETLIDIASGSLAVAPYHYGEAVIDADQVLTYETKEVDLTVVSEEFADYASQYFKMVSRNKTALEIADIEDEEQKERMLDFFTELNQQYFAGQVDPEMFAYKEAQEWLSMGGFAAAYLQEIQASCGEHQSVKAALK